MCDCFSKEDSQAEKETLNLFQARIGGIDPQQRLKLIFAELQELENDVCRRSKGSRSRSDCFWWINVAVIICMIGGSAGVVIVEAFTEQKNIPVIVLGAVMIFVGTVQRFLKLDDRGFTYRQGNFNLQRIRQQIRDIIYRFQNYTPEQLLIQISNIRNNIDEIDIELYRSNMTGNVKFDSDYNIIIDTDKADSEQDRKPSEIRIIIDSQNSSPHSSPENTPRISPHVFRQIQRLKPGAKTASDSDIGKRLSRNSLEVPRRKGKEEHSMPALQVE